MSQLGHPLQSEGDVTSAVPGMDFFCQCSSGRWQLLVPHATGTALLLQGELLANHPLGSQLLTISRALIFNIRIEALRIPEASYRPDLLGCSPGKGSPLPLLVPPFPPLHLTQTKLNFPLVWDFLPPLFLSGIQVLRLAAYFCPLAKLVWKRKIPGSAVP